MQKAIKTVIKIEIETLLDNNGKLSSEKMEHLSMVCANLQNSGVQILLVSSGAIALGTSKLNMKKAPDGITAKQAVAAVGQTELIIAYQNYFDDFNQLSAQVLLTRDVIDNPLRNSNAKNTLTTMLNKNIIPIVNENDSVSTNDIIVNDNYPLVLIVASLTDADAIVVNTFKRDKFKLILRNRSFIFEITLEELLDLSETINRVERRSCSEITGFPEFYQNSGIN